MEFDEFTPELTTFLERYRASEKSKKELKAKLAASRAAEEEGDDDDEDLAKVATPQSAKSKDTTDGADVSMADDGDHTEEEGDDAPVDQRDNMAEDGDDEDDADDMEE